MQIAELAVSHPLALARIKLMMRTVKVLTFTRGLPTMTFFCLRPLQSAMMELVTLGHIPKAHQLVWTMLLFPTTSPYDCVSTWVSTRIDLALHRRDHDCVCAELQLQFFPADRRPRRTRGSKVQDTHLDVTWVTDVHTHAARLQHWIKQWNPKPRIWRKRHLSDDTKQLIDAKRHHWKCLNAARRHHCRGLLRQLFAAWRQPHQVTWSFQGWMRDCDRAYAWHLWAYEDLAPRVVQAVRNDDCMFYESLAAQAGYESSKNAQSLWIDLAASPSKVAK